MNIPTKYTAGVDKQERTKEIVKRKADAKKGVFSSKPTKTDKVAVKKGLVKESGFTSKFKSNFGDIPYDLASFAKKFKIPLDSLKDVEKRGLGAFYSSGSRAGVSPQAWTRARVYRLLLVWTGKIKPPPKSDPDTEFWENRPK